MFNPQNVYPYGAENTFNPQNVYPYSAVNTFNAPLGVYSPQPNAYSPQPPVVYSATRDSFKNASGQNSGPTSSASGPPAYADGASGARYGWTGAPPTISQQTTDESKMSVSIDFGESSTPDSLPKRS